MNYVLGESQISSRLAQELREKNALVYGFGSGLQLDRDTNVGALVLVQIILRVAQHKCLHQYTKC